MKTITIKVIVPDNFTEAQEIYLRDDAENLVHPDWLHIFWHVEDVLEGCPDLDPKQAREVLRIAKKYHNAEVGINWDVLKQIADDQINKDEDEEEG